MGDCDRDGKAFARKRAPTRISPDRASHRALAGAHSWAIEIHQVADCGKKISGEGLHVEHARMCAALCEALVQVVAVIAFEADAYCKFNERRIVGDV